MNVTKVGNKIIPAAIIASAMAVGNVKAQKQADTIPVKDKIENVSEETEKSNAKNISWKDVMFYLTLGTVGGTLGAITVNKSRKAKNTQNTVNDDNYFTNQFKNDARGLRTYLNNTLNNMRNDNSYTFDGLDFDKNTQDFAMKYPSRGTYLRMLPQVLADKRLNSSEKYLLGCYLEDKATFSPEEKMPIALSLYGPILDGIEDYETLVKEFKANPPHKDNEEDGYVDDCDENTVRIIGGSHDRKNIHHNFTFSDVGGQNEAIKTLKEEILYPIKYPSGFKHDSISNGIILYGPPGTGKTLIAEALANESSAYFVKLNGNDLTSKWVGESEENWRNLFKDAIEHQPCIIFIDEFDGIASARGRGDIYNDKVVNQILSLVSDVEKNNYKIYLIAATNKLDMLDKAIIRSERFGTHIELKPPQTKEDVSQILKIHLSKKPFENIEKDKFDSFLGALLEANATGADIALVVSNAYKKAKERNSIFEKMENNTFNESDMENVKISSDDLSNAISELKDKNKRKSAIGFNKTISC